MRNDTWDRSSETLEGERFSSGDRSENSTPSPAGTGLLYDPRYLLHDTGAMHPERPERLQIILESLEGADLVAKTVPVEAMPAEPEVVASIHYVDYIEKVRRLSLGGGGMLDPDTVVSRHSYEIALLASGGFLRATEAVAQGRIANVFALVRPPGHHALPDKGMGFCIFNNVAIAARYLQKAHGFERILIVDWDVHHGNGTQAVFYDDPSVFYFSIHRYPYYPGTGAADETGTGKGKGFTLNIPMPAGSTSSEYVAQIEAKFVPAVRKYRPDFVLISAGFDAHSSDPLGGMLVRSECFGQLTDIVCEIAHESCQGRVASVLEGGYHYRGLSEGPLEHLKALLKHGAAP